MNEHEELQAALQDDGLYTPSSSPPRESVEAVGARSVRVNYAQWEIEPNDSYCPTGGTTDKLPPGVYNLSPDNYGRVHFIKARVLTDKLIDLKDSAANEIIDGIRTFWKSEEKFKERGLLYKRGILLWGPPGGGKTCLIAQLIKELTDQGGMVLLCSHPSVMVAGLSQMRRIEPDRRLIVVEEDVEEIMREHGEHALLALLDGENQIANVVHIATTNYPAQLGARIINRPSRFDEVRKIGMPNEYARRAYLDATTGGLIKSIEELDKWVQDTDGMSIAHLKELVAAIFCLGRGYDETLLRLKQMAIRPRDHEDGFKSHDNIGLAPQKKNGKWVTADKGWSFTGPYQPK